MPDSFISDRHDFFVRRATHFIFYGTFLVACIAYKNFFFPFLGDKMPEMCCCLKLFINCACKRLAVYSDQNVFDFCVYLSF